MNRRQLRIVEFLLWVLVVSTLVGLASALLGYAIGGSLLTVKYVLFVVGFLLFGIGAIGMQPVPVAPHKNKLLSLENGSQSRLEALIQKIPPLKNQPLRFEHRVRRSIKIFTASLVVLSLSLYLEFGLGVAV